MPKAENIKYKMGEASMYMQKKRNIGTAGIGVVVAVLIICELASMIVLFGRMTDYAEAKFVNVMPLIEDGDKSSSLDESTPVEIGSDMAVLGNTAPMGVQGATNTNVEHSEFYMEAEAEIFRFSYDNESGTTTVIGAEGNTDKLIAPGTSNLYQFTLQNPSNMAMEYTLTMEAYVTGTDLKIPVNARVWDYTNKYLVGSADDMVDVMELNTVNETAGLGANRYAIYNLEWEWPFEWGDDEHDTKLGNLAVDEDLVLHIVIRTVAEYDEDPNNPNAGLVDPPRTGDPIVSLVLLFIISVMGLCATLIVFFRTKRKEKQAERE